MSNEPQTTSLKAGDVRNEGPLHPLSTVKSPRQLLQSCRESAVISGKGNEEFVLFV